VYAHFSGARRLDGKAAGNISIFWFEHGWFWFIPMRNGITSVGVVTWPYFMKTREKRSLQQFLLDAIATCPALAERMQEAKIVSEAEATGNFSYVSDHTYGANYLLLGDAFAFIDPIFSSGVLFAMNSALVGATAVDTYLREPQAAPAALREFDRQMRHGPKEFSWFIYRMNNPIMRELFMGPRNVWRVKEALLSVLAGDIFGKTPIWPSVYMFKLMFYLSSLKNLRTSLRAKKQRALNIRPVDDPNMATDS
jgi:flavin-dependent dehydrogenase